MKMRKLFVNALLAALLSFAFHAPATAQKTALPVGLSQQSSLAEVLNWLNQNSFAEARIGLEADGTGVSPNDIPTAGTTYYEQAFFSKGFKVAKIDGCKLTLRNDNVELISFETAYPNPAEGSLDMFRKVSDKKSTFAGEFFIPLEKLKANKAPFRHTKKEEKAEQFGTWRTEFKVNYGFSLIPRIARIPSQDKIKELMENAMRIEIIGAGTDGRNDKMTGGELTFTFDDKQKSEDFYAAMSRAITLCKEN